MDREALRQALREKLEHDTGESVARLDDDVNLRTDLNLDSIDVVSLVIHMQSEYGIQLETEELEPVVHVGQLLDLILAKMAAKSQAA
jgi:acyl carrier protein